MVHRVIQKQSGDFIGFVCVIDKQFILFGDCSVNKVRGGMGEAFLYRYCAPTAK